MKNQTMFVRIHAIIFKLFYILNLLIIIKAIYISNLKYKFEKKEDIININNYNINKYIINNNESNNYSSIINKRKYITLIIYNKMPFFGEILSLCLTKNINYILSPEFIFYEKRIIEKYLIMLDFNNKNISNGSKLLLNILLCNINNNELRKTIILLIDSFNINNYNYTDSYKFTDIADNNKNTNTTFTIYNNYYNKQKTSNRINDDKLINFKNYINNDEYLNKDFSLLKEVINVIIINYVLKKDIFYMSDSIAKIDLLNMLNKINYEYEPIEKIEFIRNKFDNLILNNKLKDKLIESILELSTRERVSKLILNSTHKIYDNYKNNNNREFLLNNKINNYKNQYEYQYNYITQNRNNEISSFSDNYDNFINNVNLSSATNLDNKFKNKGIDNIFGIKLSFNNTSNIDNVKLSLFLKDLNEYIRNSQSDYVLDISSKYMPYIDDFENNISLNGRSIYSRLIKHIIQLFLVDNEIEAISLNKETKFNSEYKDNNTKTIQSNKKITDLFKFKSNNSNNKIKLDYTKNKETDPIVNNYIKKNKQIIDILNNKGKKSDIYDNKGKIIGSIDNDAEIILPKDKEKITYVYNKENKVIDINKNSKSN